MSKEPAALSSSCPSSSPLSKKEGKGPSPFLQKKKKQALCVRNSARAMHCILLGAVRSKAGNVCMSSSSVNKRLAWQCLGPAFIWGQRKQEVASKGSKEAGGPRASECNFAADLKKEDGLELSFTKERWKNTY